MAAEAGFASAKHFDLPPGGLMGCLVITKAQGLYFGCARPSHVTQRTLALRKSMPALCVDALVGTIYLGGQKHRYSFVLLHVGKGNIGGEATHIG
eukprot:6498592-Pyramimonas_sp.AAC.2